MNDPASSDFFRRILTDYRRAFAAADLKRNLYLFFAAAAVVFHFYVLLFPLLNTRPDPRPASFLLITAFFLIIAMLIRRYLKLKDPDDPVLNNEKILSVMGRKLHGFPDRVLNVYQILQKKQDPLSLYALDNLKKDIAGTELVDRRDLPQLENTGNLLIIAAAALIISVFLNPQRWQSVFMPPPSDTPHLTLTVLPGDVQLYPLDSLKLKIISGFPESFVHRLTLLEQDDEIIQDLQRTGDSIMYFILPRVLEPLRYTVDVRPPDILYPPLRFSSDTFSVTLFRRPELLSLDFRIIPPPYTGRPERSISGNMDELQVEAGSRLILNAEFRSPVLGGYLKRREGEEDFERKSGNILTWKGMITEDDLLEVDFFNDEGVRLREPMKYTVRAVPDRWPELTVHVPEGETVLKEDMTVPYDVSVNDDYGFSLFRLEKRISHEFTGITDSIWQEVLLPTPGYSRDRIVSHYSVEDLMNPGDRLIMRFMLGDNDEVTGPKVVRSDEFTMLFPSLTDLFTGTFNRQEDTAQDLERMLETAQEIGDKSREIREELLKKGELDWEDTRSIKELAEDQQAQLEELKQIRDELQEQLDEMKEKGVFASETLELFEKLQELMDDLADSDLFRELQRLQEKLSSLNERSDEELPRDLESFNNAQKEFSESLERTLELFQDLLREEQLDELAARLARALDRQEEILEDAGSQSAAESGRDEKGLSQELENTRDFLDSMSGNEEDAFNRMLDELQENMSETDPSGKAAESASSFEKNDMNEGINKAEQTRSGLQSLSKSLGSMRQAYNESRTNDVIEAFRRIYVKTMDNSFDQEALNAETRDPGLVRDDFSRVSSRQYIIFQRFQNILIDLNSLAQNTFQVDRDLAVAAGKVQASLSRSMQMLEEGNAHGWLEPSVSSLRDHNALAFLLLQKMDEIRASGDATGMEQFMQQMMAMAGQQQSMNGQSSRMSLFGPGNPSQMSEMAKMAARQQALRKSLAQLDAEMKASGKKGLGDLGRITEEMGDVIDDLRKGSYNRRTRMRQQEILQRMLTAANSMRTRDRSEERESRSASPEKIQDQVFLPDDLGDRETILGLLRDALRDSNIPLQDRLDMEKYIEELRFSYEE